MSLARIQQLFSELKHRRVFRVAGLYLVAGWVVVQVAATVFPVLEIPPWALKLVVALAILGFPFALGLAWAFDIENRDGPTARLADEGTPPGADRGRILRIPWLRQGLTVLLVLVLITGGWAKWRGMRGATGSSGGVSPEVIAVLPFDVRATGADDWRDGMVSLLAVRLDGVAGLRSVDPQPLLRLARTGAPTRPEMAQRVASRMGAGLFVLGSIVGVGRRIQVMASLYETGRGGPVATASAEGTADSIFEMVARIAIHLLATRVGPQGSTVGAAALTTTSLPALRAYLEGERAFREGKVGTAFEAFTRAITLDSTFALAYSRLSSVSNWHGDDSLAVWASAAAERHAAHLSPRFRELLAADVAFLRGDPDVESRLRQLLDRYPQDAEVWYRLGEVLFHRNSVHGRSIMEAREPFEQALLLDPGNEKYIGHLRDLACLGERVHDLAGLPPPPQPDPFNPITNGPLTDGTIVALAGASAERERTLSNLVLVPDNTFLKVMDYAPLCVPPEVLPRLFAVADRRREQSDTLLLYGLEAARGRWSVARQGLLVLQEHDSIAGVLNRAAIVLDPLRTPDRNEIEQARADLQALDLSRMAETRRSIPDTMNNQPERRLYLLGMLAARFGDPKEAAEYAARLDRLPPTSPFARAETPLLLALLRAATLARAGRRIEALRVLDEFDARGLIPGGMVPGAAPLDNTRERWLRAELLRELGQEREALAWYVTLVEVGYAVYIPPALLRVAQMREQLGQSREAARAYRRFLALWRDADPEVQPLVRDAERRLAALER